MFSSSVSSWVSLVRDGPFQTGSSLSNAFSLFLLPDLQLDVLVGLCLDLSTWNLHFAYRGGTITGFYMFSSN